MNTEWQSFLLGLMQQRTRGNQAVSESASLNDLGFDSLDLVELVVNFEGHTGISLDENQLMEAATVGEFLGKVKIQIENATNK